MDIMSFVLSGGVAFLDDEWWCVFGELSTVSHNQPSDHVYVADSR
jgi:hypothetical protein